jgi:predicted nucleotidyltransferase
MSQVLAEHPRRVAQDILAEEEKKRTHLVVALSGAQAYGFPSPDSDLDLKGIHVAPTRALLGLTEPHPSCDRMGLVEGVELDYASHELAAALRALVKGNGNYLERVLGRHLVWEHPWLSELAPLVRAGISKRYYRHYQGLARQQLQELERHTEPRVKTVLHVLRSALTGVHLLRTGELQVDLNPNLEAYAFSDAAELIQQKRQGERIPLDAKEAAYWRTRVLASLTLLEEAHADSSLPDDVPNAAELEQWLIDVRLRQAP